jgi:hypothetical protein
MQVVKLPGLLAYAFLVAMPLWAVFVTSYIVRAKIMNQYVPFFDREDWIHHVFETNIINSQTVPIIGALGLWYLLISIFGLFSGIMVMLLWFGASYLYEKYTNNVLVEWFKEKIGKK